LSTGSFNNVNELTALSGGGVVGFTGTTTEEAAVTVGGQAAQTSEVGTRFEKAVTLPAGTNTVTVAAVDPSGNTSSKNYRVVVSGGAAQSFTYDANGNMTSDGVRIYAWDAENRLIRIVEGAKRTEIEYDGFHHWTRIVERNGATTVSDRRFIWDGNTLVEQRNGTSTTAAQRYLPQGVQQGTNKFFYTRDHLGSIREVVNNSGGVVARYDYDPYGRRTKLSGTFDSDFGFTGHYYHAPSGLHFAPFRAYSAELGRWLSRDPIEEGGGINLYRYVSNRPVTAVDPLGLWDGALDGVDPFDPDYKSAGPCEDSVPAKPGNPNPGTPGRGGGVGGRPGRGGGGGNNDGIEGVWLTGSFGRGVGIQVRLSVDASGFHGFAGVGLGIGSGVSGGTTHAGFRLGQREKGLTVSAAASGGKVVGGSIRGSVSNDFREHGLGKFTLSGHLGLGIGIGATITAGYAW
jgi:RHS repeat-associated protein